VSVILPKLIKNSPNSCRSCLLLHRPLFFSSFASLGDSFEITFFMANEDEVVCLPREAIKNLSLDL
jgi:hypothetical protein